MRMPADPRILQPGEMAAAFVIECRDCNGVEAVLTNNRATAVRNVQMAGWFWSNNGWVCPECMEARNGHSLRVL